MCSPAYRVAELGFFGFAASRFWNWISRESPTFIRSTSGRGRLPGRRVTRPLSSSGPAPATGTTSSRRAKIIPPGCEAPSRLRK